MTVDLVVKNGKLVSSMSITDSGIAINRGVIVAVS